MIDKKIEGKQTCRMQFNPRLFWDVKIEDIDFDAHARFVIERVVSSGTWQDWQNLKYYYGLNKIREELLAVRYLPKRDLIFFSSIFNIPKSQFRCYTQKSSMPQLWPF